MPSEQAAPTKTETVLVVEDEVFVRMIISDYLRHCGYKVIEAANGDEALIILKHNEIQVDIVFSDIEMPGTFDGFSLAKWVRENRHGVDVVLAGSVPRAASEAAELCESGPLPKPYEPQIVVDRIKRLMRARGSRSK